MDKKNILNGYLKVIQEDVYMNEIGVIAALGMASSVMMILRFANDLGKDYLTKAGRECIQLKGASRNVCVVMNKMRAIDKQIDALHTGMGKCSSIMKLGRSDNCREKINQKIQDLQRKKQDLQKHYTMFKAKEQQEQQAEHVSM